MKKNITGIASQIKLTPDILVIQSNNLTSQKVNTWIKSLSDKDIAIFYYAGNELYVHNNKWPCLSFYKKKTSLISQKTLAFAIKRRNAYLTLVLFDCYSKAIKVPKKSFSIDNTVPLQRTSKSPGLVSLFTKNHGFVCACSTRRGRPGLATYRNEPIGGLFTTIVQNYFNDMCNTGTPFWGDLYDQMKFFCAKLSHKQQRPYMYKNVHNPDLGKPIQK
jgi:hypothetical protein